MKTPSARHTASWGDTIQEYLVPTTGSKCVGIGCGRWNPTLLPSSSITMPSSRVLDFLGLKNQIAIWGFHPPQLQGSRDSCIRSATKFATFARVVAAVVSQVVAPGWAGLVLLCEVSTAAFLRCPQFPAFFEIHTINSIEAQLLCLLPRRQVQLRCAYPSNCRCWIDFQIFIYLSS